MASSDIEGLLKALKAWQKAVRQITSKDLSADAKQKSLEDARNQVLDYLETDSVAGEIDALIQQAIAPNSLTPDDVRRTLIQDSDPLLAIELRTVHPLSVSRKDLETLVHEFL
jgi:hypothetical protein